jgi:hypothetical protein
VAMPTMWTDWIVGMIQTSWLRMSVLGALA